MASLASRAFWLDGGYDRDSVDACPYAPSHKWWEFRLADVLEPCLVHDEDELMCICQGCYVPRCGHVQFKGEHGWERTSDPCVLPRHHEGHHLPASRALEVPDRPPAS